MVLQLEEVQRECTKFPLDHIEAERGIHLGHVFGGKMAPHHTWALGHRSSAWGTHLDRGQEGKEIHHQGRQLGMNWDTCLRDCCHRALKDIGIIRIIETLHFLHLGSNTSKNNSKDLITM